MGICLRVRYMNLCKLSFYSFVIAAPPSLNSPVPNLSLPPPHSLDNNAGSFPYGCFGHIYHPNTLLPLPGFEGVNVNTDTTLTYGSLFHRNAKYRQQMIFTIATRLYTLHSSDSEIDDLCVGVLILEHTLEHARHLLAAVDTNAMVRLYLILCSYI